MKQTKYSFSPALVVYSCLYFSSSFAAPISTIDGQIFVVTKAQQTVKLALVNVVAMSEKDLVTAIAARTHETIRQAKELAEKIEQKKQEIIALRTGLKDSSGYSPLDELERVSDVCYRGIDVDAMLRCSRDGEGKVASDRMIELHEKYKAEFDPIFKARGVLRSLMREHRALNKMILSQLTSSDLSSKYVGQTKSDGDGKFSLTMPQGQRVGVVASAQRAVGEKTESYQWIVWFTAKKGARNNLFLANDNLLETRCAACFQQLDLTTYPDVHGAPEFITAR